MSASAVPMALSSVQVASIPTSVPDGIESEKS